MGAVQGQYTQDRASGRSEADKSSSEIRRDIEHTRASMSETLDVLADKLRPRHMLDRVAGYFSRPRGASGESIADSSRRYGRKTVGTIKDHPVPAILVGAGLAWLLVDQLRGRGEEDDEYEYPVRRSGAPVSQGLGDPMSQRPEPRPTDPVVGHGSYGPGVSGTAYGGAVHPAEPGYSMGAGAGTGRQSGMVERGKRSMGDVGESASRARGRLRGMASRLRTSAMDTASSMRSRMSGTGSKVQSGTRDMSARAAAGIASGSRRAREAARSAASQASELARSMKHRGGEGLSRAGRKAEDVVHEYPWAVGFAALGIGALLGVLLPLSRRENEWFGEHSEEMKRRAREQGRELMDAGKAVATRTADEVREDIKRQGLDPDSLREKAGDIASHAKETAKDTAEDEGLVPEEGEEASRERRPESSVKRESEGRSR